MTYRVATYNLENLFRRARILNLRDEARSQELLGWVRDLQSLIDRKTYTDANRKAIFDLSAQLRVYIDFRVDMGSFGDWRKQDSASGSVTGWQVFKSCKGRDDWLGQLVYTDQEFSDEQRANTAKVLVDVNADAVCTIEVEGMDALNMFNRQGLKNRYKQYVSIDSPNDPRHIDVGFLSKRPIRSIRTHIFDMNTKGKSIFSRDCLRVEVEGPAEKPIHFLCNHFKSQRSSSSSDAAASAARRKAQAGRVSEILTGGYNLKKDLVVVLGDLNEDPESPHQSIKPLVDTPDLISVTDLAAPRGERWTYHYGGAKKGERLSQLDYIFVSKALFARLKKVGYERRGIFDVEKITTGEAAPVVKAYPSVTKWSESASDHAALWADFDL